MPPLKSAALSLKCILNPGPTGTITYVETYSYQEELNKMKANHPQPTDISTEERMVEIIIGNHNYVKSLFQ